MRAVNHLLLLAAGVALVACQSDSVGPVMHSRQARLYITGLTNASDHLFLARIADYHFSMPAYHMGLDVAAFPQVRLQTGTNITSFGTVKMICVVPESFAQGQSTLPVHLWLEGNVDTRPISGEYRGPLTFTGETNVVAKIYARFDQWIEQRRQIPDMSDLAGTITVPAVW